MDSSYNARVPAATEMIAVFCVVDEKGAGPAVPELRVIGPNLGMWQRIDIELEWEFQEGTERQDFEARLEPTCAQGRPDRARWQGDGQPPRASRLPLLYAPASRPGLDSRLTVWSKSRGFTFRITDLEQGPILIPEHGVFVTKAGSGRPPGCSPRSWRQRSSRAFGS